VDIVSIGSSTLRLRLAGPFVADGLDDATRRLVRLGALGFDLVEIDAAEVSVVDRRGRDVLDDFVRCVERSGCRLETFDPGHFLTAPRAA